MMDLIGRESQARAIIANTQASHNSLLIGEAGIGKSAILQWIEPLLQDMGTPIYLSRVGPAFTTFLKEFYTGLWEHNKIEGKGNDLAADLKA